MYDESKLENNIVKPVRETRNSVKINFKQNRINSKKYEKCPYCRGKSIWDTLDVNTQHSDNKFEFMKKISRKFLKYVKDYPL